MQKRHPGSHKRSRGNMPGYQAERRRLRREANLRHGRRTFWAGGILYFVQDNPDQEPEAVPGTRELPRPDREAIGWKAACARSAKRVRSSIVIVEAPSLSYAAAAPAMPSSRDRSILGNLHWW